MHEATAAMLFRTHQILYARIVEVDGVPIIDAAGPWALPEHMRDAILPLCGDVRERPLARELEFRNFYWGFIRSASKESSLRPQTRYSRSPRRAAGRLSMMLAPAKTSAETKSEKGDQQILSLVTHFCDDCLNQRLAVLGNKTALEAVATPEGRLKVKDLMEEIETDFVRRLRERLGLLPATCLN